MPPRKENNASNNSHNNNNNDSSDNNKNKNNNINNSNNSAGKNNNTTGNNSNNNSSHNNNTLFSAADIAAAESAAAEQKQALYLANAKLCRLVKRCPWMYDRQHPNYAKKIVTDKSWTKIAQECDDSVASCKERWRNIRAAFARSINIYKTTCGPNRVKPYYLYNDLQFLIKPMMEGREMLNKDLDDIKSDWDEMPAQDEEKTSMQRCESGAEKAEELRSEAEVEFSLCDGEQQPDVEIDLEAMMMMGDNDNNNNNNSGSTIHNNDNNNITSSSIMANNQNNNNNNNSAHFCSNDNSVNNRLRKRSCCAAAAAAEPPLEWRCSAAKRRVERNGNEEDDSDADAKFLEALLPDMRAMNARQKIIFKRKIYQSLEEVFESSTDFPAQLPHPSALAAATAAALAPLAGVAATAAAAAALPTRTAQRACLPNARTRAETQQRITASRMSATAHQNAVPAAAAAFATAPASASCPENEIQKLQEYVRKMLRQSAANSSNPSNGQALTAIPQPAFNIVQPITIKCEEMQDFE